MDYISVSRPSDAVNLNMAELTAAAVVRIEKELLNSRTRNNKEIINYLKDSDRPREDFQVLQNSTIQKIGHKCNLERSENVKVSRSQGSRYWVP